MSYARDELFNESDESEEANPVLLLSLVNADCLAALIRSLLLCPYGELHQRRTAHPRPCPQSVHNAVIACHLRDAVCAAQSGFGLLTSGGDITRQVIVVVSPRG